MKSIFKFFFVLILATSVHIAFAQTFSENHKISFPLNGSEQFGVIQGTQYGDGSWAIIGGLELKGGRDFLRIVGTIAQFEPTILSFTGTVFFQSNSLSYQPCVRTGDIAFVKARGQKYWRSKESVSCDEKTRYLTIYF
ncbi:hypothetical protein MCEGEM3_00156 [Oxalobacteraceae bacterium]